MKKQFIILFLSSVIAFSGCSNNKKHKHNYIEKVTESNVISEADYFSGSTCYKVCEICGELSKETFVANDKIEPLKKGCTDIIYDCFPESIPSALKFMASGLAKGYVDEYIGKGLVDFRRYNFFYDSIDYENKPVTLSCTLTIPFLNNEPKVNCIVVDNHITFVDASESLINGFDICAIPAFMGAVVMEFDLIGFGSTLDRPTDYHCYHMAARNTVDGIMFLFDILKNKFNIDPSKYDLFNTGYSQGGYDCLGLLKYMEEEATNEEKDVIKIKHSYPGAGAYNVKIMVEDSLNNPYLPNPEYILMGVITAKYYHPETLGDFEIDDFLTDLGKKLVDPIMHKSQKELDDVKSQEEFINAINLKGPMAIFKDGVLDKTNDLYKAIITYCECENLVDGKWLPSGNVTMFCSTQDNLVTPNCTYAARDTFKNLDNVTFDIGSYGDHASAAVTYYINTVNAIITYFPTI